MLQAFVSSYRCRPLHYPWRQSAVWLLRSLGACLGSSIRIEAVFFVLSIFQEFSYYKSETYLPVITNVSRVEILEPQYSLDLIYRIMISYQNYERSLHSTALMLVGGLCRIDGSHTMRKAVI